MMTTAQKLEAVAGGDFLKVEYSYDIGKAKPVEVAGEVWLDIDNDPRLGSLDLKYLDGNSKLEILEHRKAAPAWHGAAVVYAKASGFDQYLVKQSDYDPDDTDFLPWLGQCDGIAAEWFGNDELSNVVVIVQETVRETVEAA